jgi:Zn-finger nucleic acid-binding protein
MTQQRERIQKVLVKEMQASAADLSADSPAASFITQLAGQLERAQIHDPDKRCCECRKPFLLVSIDGTDIDYCPRCHGFWFDTSELRHFTHALADVPGAACTTRPSRFVCPVCQEQMAESVFIKPFNLLVDICMHNHGVYFEDKEIQRALEIASHGSSTC